MMAYSWSFMFVMKSQIRWEDWSLRIQSQMVLVWQNCFAYDITIFQMSEIHIETHHRIFSQYVLCYNS